MVIAFNPQSGGDMRMGIGDIPTALQTNQRTAVAYGGNRISGPIEVATAQNAHGGTGRSDFESETFVIQTANTGANQNNVKQANVMDTLDGANSLAIAWHGAQVTSPQNTGGVFEEVTPTVNGDMRLMTGVRRLTPTECERLQGFPDGWTARQSDSQRYKQLGNAVTVSVIEWIGRRIV